MIKFYTRFLRHGSTEAQVRLGECSEADADYVSYADYLKLRLELEAAKDQHVQTLNRQIDALRKHEPTEETIEQHRVRIAAESYFQKQLSDSYKVGVASSEIKDNNE